MGLIKPDSAIAATPAGQNPVQSPTPRVGAPADLPPKDVLIIRQNAMSNAMGSPVVAALAVTAVTEKDQMDLVKSWARVSEDYVLRPYPDDVAF